MHLNNNRNLSNNRNLGDDESGSDTKGVVGAMPQNLKKKNRLGKNIISIRLYTRMFNNINNTRVFAANLGLQIC